MKVEQIVLVFKDVREHTVRLNKEKLVPLCSIGK